MKNSFTKFILGHSRILFWLVFVLTNIALFTPSVGPKGEIYNLDIIIHYSMFLALGFFALSYFRNPAIILVILFFIPLSEIIQEVFVSGRGYEFTDILSGTAGLLTGLLISQRLTAMSR